MSRKSRDTGEILYGKTRKIKRRKIVTSNVSPLSIFGFFYLGRDVTALQVYVIKSKNCSDVVTLTQQFANRCNFPDFVHFVFPVAPLPPSLALPFTLKKKGSFSCQRGNTAITFTVDNVRKAVTARPTSKNSNN